MAAINSPPSSLGNTLASQWQTPFPGTLVQTRSPSRPTTLCHLSQGACPATWGIPKHRATRPWSARYWSMHQHLWSLHPNPYTWDPYTQTHINVGSCPALCCEVGDRGYQKWSPTSDGKPCYKDACRQYWSWCTGSPTALLASKPHSFFTQLLSTQEVTQCAPFSACIKGSLGVRNSQKLPWDFQKSVPGSLGLPTFKDI